jgi:hypothetical protein
MGARCRRHDQICGLDWSPGLPPVGEQTRVKTGRFAVERQYASIKFIGEYGGCRGFQFGATAALWKDGDAGQDFGLAGRWRP